MDGIDFLPNDLAECQRLLVAAFKQATQLERRMAEAHKVLEWIRQLYDIEDRARPWLPEARHQLHVADRFEDFLDHFCRVLRASSSSLDGAWPTRT